MSSFSAFSLAAQCTCNSPGSAVTQRTEALPVNHPHIFKHPPGFVVGICLTTYTLPKCEPGCLRHKGERESESTWWRVQKSRQSPRNTWTGIQAMGRSSSTAHSCSVGIWAEATWRWGNNGVSHKYLISQVKTVFFPLPSWLSLWSTHPLHPRKTTPQNKFDCSEIHTGNDQSLLLLLAALSLFTKSLHQLSALYVTGSNSLFQPDIKYQQVQLLSIFLIPFPNLQVCRQHHSSRSEITLSCSQGKDSAVPSVPRTSIDPKPDSEALAALHASLPPNIPYSFEACFSFNILLL